VRQQTVFFGAASATMHMFGSTAILGESAPLIAGSPAINGADYNFLENMSSGLEGKNTAAFASIVSGTETLSGAALNTKLIKMEQDYVQNQLDALIASTPEAAQKLLANVNKMMNVSDPLKFAAGVLSMKDRAYLEVLDSVRESLGKDIDFAQQRGNRPSSCGKGA
jgi:hypothetical protein